MSVKTHKKKQRSEQKNRVSPGEILSRARKERGLAVEEVILNLGITKRILNALEHDEYDCLPSPIYVKGYIKRYCSILDIPDEDVLAGFDSRISALGLEQRKPTFKLDGVPRKKRRVWMWGISAVLIVLVATLLWTCWFNTDEALTAVDLPETASSNKFSEQAVLQQTSPEILSNNDVVSPAKRPVTSGAQILHINVVQQSWIEILDAQGDILLADLKPSGYQGEVSGLAPFEVILGNAPGVVLSFKGERVNMPSIGNDKTVKLKVGDTD